MTLARVWPTGIADDEPATGAALTQLDLNVSRSLDGYTGGQATPSAQIDLRGTGGGAGSAVNFEHYPTLDPIIVTRVQPIIPMFGTTGSSFQFGKWEFNTTNLLWEVVDPTTGDSYLAVPLSNLVDLSNLVALRFYVKAGGYTTLPTTMPEVEIEYLDSSGVVQSPTPQDVSDTSADTTAFNQWHVISLPLNANLPIDHKDAPKDIYARIEYFSSGSAGAGREFRIGRIEADFTVTKLVPGG